MTTTRIEITPHLVPMILAVALANIGPAEAVAIRSYPNAPGYPPSGPGLVYRLPRTLLKVSFKATLYQRIPKDQTAADASRMNHRFVCVLQPESISVAAVTRADQNLAFFVPTANLKALLVETKKAELNLNPDGTLAQATLNTSDKTAEVIQDTLETAENIAKIAVIAAAMAEKKPAPGAATPGPVAVKVDTLKTIASFSVQQLLDPDAISDTYRPVASSSIRRAAEDAVIKTRGNSANLFCEGLQIRSLQGYVPVSTSAALLQPKQKFIEGVVVRNAKPIEYEFARSRDPNDPCDVVNPADPLYDPTPSSAYVEILTKLTAPILQAGYLSNLPLHSSMFADRTQSFTSNDQKTSYTLTSTSSVEKLSKAFANVVKNVADFSAALPQLRFNVRETAANAETSLVNNKTSLAEEQENIKKLQDQLDVTPPHI
jgi:hypothetical protein